MLVIEWVEKGCNVLTPDGLNMLELPNTELYKLYGEYFSGSHRDRNANIRRIANKLRTKVREGKLMAPERQEPYNPDIEPERIAARRRKAARNLGGKAVETTVLTIPTEHLAYHEALQAHLDEFGAVSKATYSEYQMLTKDSDNEAQIHDLRAKKFEVNFKSEPDWPPVTRVESVKLPRKERKEKLSGLPKTDIIADLQWPYIDREALDVTCQILRDRKPDTLIIGGDMLDLSAWSKYEQMPEWATVTQQSIIEIHQFLAKLRKMLPETRIIVVEGNHERRMPTMLLTNAKAAYGLKRADDIEGWPVMSITYLTAMDDLGVEYVDGFPANTIWITPELQFKHRAKGRGAKAVADNERYSTVYGDNHRVESSYKTYQTHEGAKTYGVFGVGCLCRLDGHVPSVNSGRHLDGSPVVAYPENWQQGIMLIDHHEDGSFNANQIFIDTFNNHRAIYNNKVYEPRAAE